jgi:hypothetical protein
VFECDSAEGKREVEVYNRLNASSTSHDGAMFIRTALDSFQVGSAEGLYQCLVHQPLGISLNDLRNQFAAKVLPEKLVKLTLLHLLLALDYLHAEAGIIHTGTTSPLTSHHASLIWRSRHTRNEYYAWY